MINTPTSTTTIEDNIRNIEESISVTQEEPITRTGNNGRLKGYFCSDVVFNISHKVLTDLEISVLGKGLDFSPTPTVINEADLRRDFASFSIEGFSEIPAFRIKVLSQIEGFIQHCKHYATL